MAELMEQYYSCTPQHMKVRDKFALIDQEEVRFKITPLDLKALY